MHAITTITPEATNTISTVGEASLGFTHWLLDVSDEFFTRLERVGTRIGAGYGTDRRGKHAEVFTGYDLCAISACAVETGITRHVSHVRRPFIPETYTYLARDAKSGLLCGHYFNKVRFSEKPAITIDFTYGQFDPSRAGLLICCDLDVPELYHPNPRTEHDRVSRKLESGHLYRQITTQISQGKIPGLRESDIVELSECFG